MQGGSTLVGIRHLHISHSTPCLKQRLKQIRLYKLLGCQFVLWEMQKWRMKFKTARMSHFRDVSTVDVVVVEFQTV